MLLFYHFNFKDLFYSVGQNNTSFLRRSYGWIRDLACLSSHRNMGQQGTVTYGWRRGKKKDQCCLTSGSLWNSTGVCVFFWVQVREGDHRAKTFIQTRCHHSLLSRTHRPFMPYLYPHKLCIHVWSDVVMPQRWLLFNSFANWTHFFYPQLISHGVWVVAFLLIRPVFAYVFFLL